MPGRPAPTMILVAGFGDNRSVFAPLLRTRPAQAYRLTPIDLPGFGAPPLPGRTTLKSMAEAVDAQAPQSAARIVLAHSVASIIASLAVQMPGSPIDTILSLEGNLSADDAYFSGMAAAFDNPATFRAAFLGRLSELARTDSNIARYRAAVERADPTALWELGLDVHTFSATQPVGDVLARAGRVTYFYNPVNLSSASLAWLEKSGLKRVCLSGASHWKCFDQPELFAERVIEAECAPKHQSAD